MVSKRANSRTTLWNTAHDSRLNSEDYDIEVTEEDLKDRFDYNSPIFCMALKDYFDPYDEEQLSFVAGQLIKVLGQDNEKGLVFGEIGRKRGFCPRNLLTEIVQSSIILNDAESPQWENVHFFLYTCINILLFWNPLLSKIAISCFFNRFVPTLSNKTKLLWRLQNNWEENM